MQFLIGVMPKFIGEDFSLSKNGYSIMEEFVDVNVGQEALYGGEVVKLLQYGSCGFIKTFLGDQVFFDKKSFAHGNTQLNMGECVVFHLRTRFDKKKQTDTLYAADILRASEL